MNLILFGGIIALAAYSMSYWQNFFFGPTRVDDDFLLTAGADAGPGALIRYVELRDRELIDTGWEGAIQRDGKRVYGDKFFVMPVKDRFMLVMADSQADGKLLVGPLYKFGTPVEHEVFAAVESQHPEWRGKLLATMINGKAAFKVIGYIGLAVLFPLMILSLVNIVRALK